MHNLSAHIPIDRLQAVILATELPLQSVGAVLLADLSGFTPLTEMLARDLGSRRGMEALTALLDQVYDQLVECVHRYGGSVIAFSGDALTAWFRGDDAAPAIACGMAMQSAMAAFSFMRLTSGHLISLNLKVAISGGLIQRCVVGDPALHCIDVLAGEPLDRLGKLEELAGQDEVLVDQRLVGAISGMVSGALRTSPEGEISGVVVTALATPVLALPWPSFELPASMAAELERWVAPAVLARLRDEHSPFLNELRPIGALFLQFALQAATPEAWRAELDSYVRDAQRVLSRYDGTLIQLTIGEKGNYLYAVFGAPIAHEDDTIRMIQAARALSRLPGTAPAPPRIGIAQGTARAGIYGGKSRRTYGVLGDAVNLAARLMQKALPGQILANDQIWSNTPAGICWDLLPPLTLKGKRQSLIVARLIDESGESQPGQPARSSAPLVGRFEELQIIHERLEMARSGQGQVVVITGEAGIGKSRLINELYQRQAGWQILSGGGQSYRMGQSYSAWTPIWQQIFGLDPTATPSATIERIAATLGRWDSASLARMPLLNSVLNLDIPENNLTAGLEARLRKALLETLLTTCFRAYAADMALADRPVLIVIEDAHWLDQLSLDLFDQIGQAVGGVAAALVVTTRPNEVGSANPLETLADQPHTRSMTLPELAPAEVSDLLALRWRQLSPQASGITLERLHEQVIPRASGNPFYIEELISFLAASATPLDEHTGWQNVELPLGLHRLVLSRIDRLDEHHQRVLKVASVLGAEFPRAWLEECYPDGDPAGRIGQDLAVLQRHDLLSANAESGMCQFRHSITQEVIYESLARSTQQGLHEQVAGHLEGSAGSLDQYLNLLAYHYERSPNDRKALWYMARNAERAARLFANRDAVRHYQTALERAAGSRAELPFPAETLPHGLGDVYAQMAEFDAALECYDQALDLLPAEDYLQRAQIHLQRAEVLVRATRFEETEAELTQADQLCKQADAGLTTPAVRVLLARTAELRSRQAMEQSQYQMALDWAKQGLAQLERLPTTAELALAKVQLHYSLAAAVAVTQNYDYARRVLQRAMAMVRRNPHPIIEAELLQHRARVAGWNGFPHLALRWHRQAAELFETTGRRDRLATSVSWLANSMIMCGKTREALEWAQRGLGIAEQTDSATLICGGLFNLGWIYSQIGQLDTALDLFRQGQVLAQRHELRSRYIDFLTFEADILLKRGDYRQSTALFEHVMALGKEFDIPQAVNIAENQLAFAELVQGRVNDDHSVAEELQSTTLPMDSLGKAHGVITTLGRWAMLAEQGATLHHDPTSFPALAAASAEFMSKHSYAAFQPIAFLVNGMVNTVLGHRKAAHSYLSRGIQVARAIDNAFDLARCLLYRGKLGLLDQSTLRQARRDLNEAARLFESMQTQPLLEKTLGLLRKVAP